MRRTMLLSLVVVAASALAGPLPGQNDARGERPRPTLPAAADTNDAGAYYAHGTARLRDRPQEAADAFYWAARLDPGRAQALYGRRAALLMSNPRRLARYMDGEARFIRSAEIQSIDSLYHRALMRDPLFFNGELDRQMFDAYITEWAKDVERRNQGRYTPGMLEYQVREYMARADVETRAWLAYTQRRFADALPLYDAAVRRSRLKSAVYADRARLHYIMGNDTEAARDMELAVKELRERDEKRLVRFYQSKSLYEHSLGLIHERGGRRDEALEAYSRALQEDLSFFPSHQRLAGLALEAGDTASAIGALALAVDLNGEDGLLRMEYGYLLAVTQRSDEGIAQLSRAAELEPHYAQIHLLLARALDDVGQTEAAVAAYGQFLDRAPRAHPLRRETALRLETLSAQQAARDLET